MQWSSFKFVDTSLVLGVVELLVMIAPKSIAYMLAESRMLLFCVWVCACLCLCASFWYGLTNLVCTMGWLSSSGWPTSPDRPSSSVWQNSHACMMVKARSVSYSLLVRGDNGWVEVIYVHRRGIWARVHLVRFTSCAQTPRALVGHLCQVMMWACYRVQCGSGLWEIVGQQLFRGCRSLT